MPFIAKNNKIYSGGDRLTGTTNEIDVANGKIGLAQTIKDKLSRALVKPIVAPTEDKLVGVDTNGVQSMLSIGSGLEVINGSLASAIVAKNLTIPTTDFVQDTTTSENYQYKATIAITGVTADMIAYVNFSIPDAESGILATFAQTYNGGVYIFASEVPEQAVDIDNIEIRVGV